MKIKNIVHKVRAEACYVKIDEAVVILADNVSNGKNLDSSEVIIFDKLDVIFSCVKFRNMEFENSLD